MAGQSTCLTDADLLNGASFILLVRVAFGAAILKGLPARCWTGSPTTFTS